MQFSIFVKLEMEQNSLTYDVWPFQHTSCHFDSGLSVYKPQEESKALALLTRALGHWQAFTCTGHGILAIVTGDLWPWKPPQMYNSHWSFPDSQQPLIFEREAIHGS